MNTKVHQHAVLGLAALIVSSALAPSPANASIGRWFGWNFSDNQTYQEIREYVDGTGKVLGLVGIVFPPAEIPGLFIRSTVILADIIDPSAERIISGRITKTLDPSYILSYAGWYGEYGANPMLPAPPVNSPVFDQTLLQSSPNAQLLSSGISIDQINGSVVIEYDWGSPGFLPTLNLNETGHFNFVGLFFKPPSPIADSLIGTSPYTEIVTTSGSFSDVLANGTNASTYQLCTSGWCGEQVPGPLPILGAGAAFGFSRRLRRRAKAKQVT
jgi:hypothetical protein